MPQTTEDILRKIKSDDMAVISLLLSDLIEEHIRGEGNDKKKLWDRYTQKDVPIYHHTVANYTKVNEKIANDFYGDIVDTKTGYMGNEVTTGLSREFYTVNENFNEEEYKRDRKFLRDWQMQTESIDQNSEMVNMAAATGLGYRLLYVAEDTNEVKTMNLPPWEVIYIADQSLSEAVVAIRYWTIIDKDTTGTGKKYTVVEWYDKENIIYYIDDGQLKNFHIDITKGRMGIDEHLFENVPIIPFINNGLKKGQPEKAITLIDAYDLIVSATTSEIEQLRLSYMYAKGMGLNIDNKFIKQLEQTGMIPLSENGEVGFINKELAIEGIQIILDEIRKNIYEFSDSIDMSKDLGGDMRVIGWQVALLPLENSSKVTERKFTIALRQQYKLLTEYWKEFQQTEIDPMALEFTFTRNFPRDLAGEAEILDSLLGNVSTQTAYSQMSFIEDPEAEIKRLQMERDIFRQEDEELRNLGNEEEEQEEEVNAD
jgi:SPP1 family phage portal protein